MSKKRVYVSSTYVDLAQHRAALKPTLEKAQFDVECMEKYPAFDERPRDKCLADVAQCDYYVLILALRYGFQPLEDNAEQMSITEMEYEQAARNRKPLRTFASGHSCLVSQFCRKSMHGQRSISAWMSLRLFHWC